MDIISLPTTVADQLKALREKELLNKQAQQTMVATAALMLDVPDEYRFSLKEMAFVSIEALEPEPGEE